MNITKSLIAAALLSSVAALSFAQAPAKTEPMSKATTATDTTNSANAAASKPAAKHHKAHAKKAKAAEPMASATTK